LKENFAQMMADLEKQLAEEKARFADLEKRMTTEKELGCTLCFLLIILVLLNVLRGEKTLATMAEFLASD
jgi:hypothetical protein